MCLNCGKNKMCITVHITSNKQACCPSLSFIFYLLSNTKLYAEEERNS